MSTSTRAPVTTFDPELIKLYRESDVVQHTLLIELEPGGPELTPAHGGFTLVAEEITIGKPLQGAPHTPMVYAGGRRSVDIRFAAELAATEWLDRLVHDKHPDRRDPGSTTEPPASPGRRRGRK